MDIAAYLNDRWVLHKWVVPPLPYPDYCLSLYTIHFDFINASQLLAFFRGLLKQFQSDCIVFLPLPSLVMSGIYVLLHLVRIGKIAEENKFANIRRKDIIGPKCVIHLHQNKTSLKRLFLPCWLFKKLCMPRHFELIFISLLVIMTSEDDFSG